MIRFTTPQPSGGAKGSSFHCRRLPTKHTVFSEKCQGPSTKCQKIEALRAGYEKPRFVQRPHPSSIRLKTVCC